MELPGGVWREGNLRRDFAFHELSGHLELAISEGFSGTEPLPVRVSTALAACLEHLGGEAAEAGQVHDLSVGDRQFLVRQLSKVLGLNEIWLTARCGQCEAYFDLQVDQARLPAKAAGKGFPFANVKTSAGKLRFRVPTGADQEAAGAVESDGESVLFLVRRLVVENGRDGAAVEALSERDLKKIEAALEAAAPEVTTLVQAACPECGHVNQVGVDPYSCLEAQGESLLSEVHLLASKYHWSESEILSLPWERRKKYLVLVERAGG